jgi:hypothetical protein
MQIRTKDEKYILMFFEPHNKAVHRLDFDCIPVSEITLNSREELLALRDTIDEILNIEEGKAKSHRRTPKENKKYRG